MKITFQIFSLLILLSSCSKNDNTLFDEKRNNIVGEWTVTQVVREIRADTVYTESSGTFDITFNQDGTGIRETFLGINVDIEWLYQYNPEKVIIIGTQGGGQGTIILASTQTYDITKNEDQRQIWESEVVLTGQIVDKYLHTWKMDKK